jgi:hypothetical protein
MTCLRRSQKALGIIAERENRYDAEDAAWEGEQSRASFCVESVAARLQSGSRYGVAGCDAVSNAAH